MDKWILRDDGVEYNEARDRYRLNGVEYTGEHFIRNEPTIRFLHERVDV